MDWIKMCDGYVRSDCIIDIHINKPYPGVVYVTLTSGDSVKYKDFGGDRVSAGLAMDELLGYLTGRRTRIEDKF